MKALPAPVERTASEARAELAAARERARVRLLDAQNAIESIGDVRSLVRRHPWACVAAAFAVGYLAAQLTDD